MAKHRHPAFYSLYLLSLAATAVALLLPNWKSPLMAQGYYSNTPIIASVSVSDSSFGLWGDNISPEPDCYGSIGNCPGKQFIDNSNFSIPNGKTEWNSNTPLSSFTSQTFSTRYTNELRSQSQMAITAAMYYKPRFNVAVAITGDGEWDLEVDISRVASIMIDERESGSSNHIDVSALNTNIAGGSLSSGTLALASLPRYSTEGVYPVSQTSKAWIHGSGAAILTFTMAYDINTVINGASFANGDAVCWSGGQANQGAGVACNPSPTAQQGLWLNGTLHVNTAPTAQADNFTATASDVTTIGNVLDNDSDANGDTLSVLDIATGNTRGTVINNGDGSFDYDPRAAFGYLDVTQTVTDSFWYRTSDGHDNSAWTPVTITIHGTRPAILPLEGIFRGSSIHERTHQQ